MNLDTQASKFHYIKSIASIFLKETGKPDQQQQDTISEYGVY